MRFGGRGKKQRFVPGTGEGAFLCSEQKLNREIQFLATASTVMVAYCCIADLRTKRG